MQNTKLIKLLRTLSEKEMKQLGVFLKSPYQNSNKRIFELFNLVKHYHAQNYESNRLQKETLFYKIFPPTTHYHDSNMRALMTGLCQRIEDFLVEKELKQNPTLKQSLLSKAFARKKLHPFSEKINRQLNATLAKEQVQDMENSQWQFQTNWDFYFHPNTQNQIQKAQSLQATMDHLDQFYLHAKFRLGLEMESRTKILQEQYKIQFWEYLKNHISKTSDLQPSVFQIFINLLQLQKEFNDPLFRTTIQLYESHLHQFGKWELNAFLMLLLNLLARQTYIGNAHYWVDAHSLHKIALEKRLFFNDGKIMFSHFFNYIAGCLYLKKFKEAENFLINYQKFLPDDIKSNTVALMQAYVCYYKGVHFNAPNHFKFAINYLNKISSNTFRFALHYRALLLRIYYDFHLLVQGDYLFFMDFSTAFQRFVNRNNKLSYTKKAPYLNYILYTKKLARLHITPSICLSNVLELKSQIQQETFLFAKDWLKEKVEALACLHRIH